jgi:hypothetical protein
MNQAEIETLIKNIDARTKRIEQLLPSFATKDDVKAFATKDDLKAFATKDDLKAFATHVDRTFATKDDLKAFTTHVDRTFATKDDVREEGERTRRHFDTVAEKMHNDIALVAEGHKATRVYVDGQLAESRKTLESYDKRIMKLEAKSMNSGGKPKRRSTRRDPS